MTDLDNKGIVTKRRNTKVKKYNGEIPFTYGPLAYFLKNRLYIGETGTRMNGFQASTRPLSTERPLIRSRSFSHPIPPIEKLHGLQARRCFWASSMMIAAIG